MRPVTGQFTTNPGWVWSQQVANYYGLNGAANGNGQSGDNYAVGGARVSVDEAGGLGVIPSLKSQATRYLAANGGKADGNALYTVWGGANDLFAATRAAAGGASQAQVQGIIGAAVTDQIALVGALKQAGAQYVLVPNLPDVGITPQFRGPNAAAATALSVSYNKALYGGLKQAGIEFIPLDTFSILREVTANPGMYGFTNVTSTACKIDPANSTQSILTCNPTSYVSPDAANTYLFADGVHPTTAGHQLLGQYAVSVLEAPRLQQVLSHSAQTIGTRAPTRSACTWAAVRLTACPGGGVRGDLQRYDHADLYDGLAPAGLFGIDWARDGLVFGGFAGFGRLNADFGNNRGDFTQKDTSVGLFAGWYGDRIWVNGQVSYTWLSYDVNRKVQLGPATREHGGSPDGSNLTAALNAGYEFGTEGGFRHGPIASVIWQKVKIDGYTESAAYGTLATALGYERQNVDSTVGTHRLAGPLRWRHPQAVRAGDLRPRVRGHQAGQRLAADPAGTGQLPRAGPEVRQELRHRRAGCPHRTVRPAEQLRPERVDRPEACAGRHPVRQLQRHVLSSNRRGRSPFRRERVPTCCIRGGSVSARKRL